MKILCVFGLRLFLGLAVILALVLTFLVAFDTRAQNTPLESKVEVSISSGSVVTSITIPATVNAEPTATAQPAPTSTPLPTSTPVPTNPSTPTAVPTATTTPPAEPTNPPVATTPIPEITPIPLKKAVMLEPMNWESQTMNNCGPMSAKMVLSYYGINVAQKQCQQALRPNQVDKMVRPDQIVSFIQNYGLRVALRENGTQDKLRALLSAGFPVITMEWLKAGSNTAHYRVVRGYDLNSNIFYYNDSMANGPKMVLSAGVQEQVWKGYDHRYMAVYPLEEEGRVLEILGEDADPKVNLSRAVETNLAYTEAFPKDLDGWANLAYSRYATGDYAEAIKIWDQKLRPAVNSSGQYIRFLWYQHWPLESYNQLGRYDEVIKLAPPVIASAEVFAEARYQYAYALAKTGRRSEAIAQLKRAIVDDANYNPIYDLLTELGAN